HGRGRLEHRCPGVDLVAGLLAVEADPGGAPLPGNGVAVAGVVVGLDELLVQVGQVGHQVGAQRLDQVEFHVGGDEPAGRHDDVVVGGAGPHSGQQVLVGGVDVVVDPEVGQGLEQGDGGVVVVVRPVVDVEPPLVAAVADGQRAAGGRGGGRGVVVAQPGHGAAGVGGPPARGPQ